MHKQLVILAMFVGALLPDLAKAANHFTLTLTDKTSGSSGVTIDVALTETGNKCEDYTFNNIPYVDYNFVIEKSGGPIMEKTPKGKVWSHEDNPDNPAARQAGHFIPNLFLEPFLVKLCPGQGAHETLDVGKLYDLPSGTYKIRAVRNTVSPEVDRTVQSNILEFIKK